MGVFDSGIDPSLIGGTSEKKVQSKSAGVFDSGIDQSLFETAPAPSHSVTESAAIPAFDSPSPIAYHAPSVPGVAPDAASQFSSALEAGDFSVKAEPSRKKNVPDLVTRGYDTATDKWAYKKTLSNTELARLEQTRPESRNVGSSQISDSSVHASQYPSIQSADTSISQDSTANTLGELAGQNFGELNPLKSLGNTAAYAGQKWRGIRKEVLEPTVGKSLYEAIQGVSMDGNFNETKKLDKVQRSLRAWRAIADTLFSPINVVASETTNPEDPSIYGGIGNVVNRFAALPFEAASSSVSALGQSVGMEKETADDLGIVLATFAPMIRGMRERGASTQEISTVVERANQTFTKIRDLSPEAKALYRKGAMELHPDVSGLPDSFMARFNDAAAKGDVAAMNSIIEEGRASKTSTAWRAYETTSEMREAAKAGDENAVIRDSQFKEAAKETALEVRDQAGKEVANVETVKYDDGTVAARANVSIDQNNEITTPFVEYKDEATAVKSSAEEAARIAQSNGSEYATAIQDKAAEVSTDIKPESKLENITDENAKVLRQFQKLVEQMKSGDVPMKMNEYGDHPEAFNDAVYKMLMDSTRTSAHYAKGGWWAEEVGNRGIEAIRKLLNDSYNPAWIERNGNKQQELTQAMLAIIDGAKMPKAQKKADTIKVSELAGKMGIPFTKVEQQISKPVETAPESQPQATSSNSQQISKPTEETITTPTNADRQESVSDSGKQGSGAGESSGWSADSGLTRGERGASVAESGAGHDDGGTGSAGKELAQTPKTRFGKTARAKLNVEVKDILEKKGYSVKESDYSPEEIGKMKEYSGAGGKIDQGAEGRGVLDEFYTPRKIVESMWGLADAYFTGGMKDATVLEPSAGVGRFLEYAPNEKNVTAHELDKVSGTILQILHPLATAKIGDFQNVFVDSGGRMNKTFDRFDIVIGNPPYGERAGLLKGLGEESNIGRWEDYFIKRGLDLTKDNGVLVYIVPSSFLNGVKETRAKVAIGKQAYLADAFRLPEGVFEDTQVATDILVFKKSNEFQNSELLYDGGYFREHPERVLWTETERKNRFGKMETAVTGSGESALKKLSEIVDSIKKPERKATEVKTAPAENSVEPKEKKPRTITSAPKKPEKVVDVSGIPTVESQTLNVGSATKQELEIFAAQEADGSISAEQFAEHPDWAPYLNYEGGRYYHDVNYFSGDIRQRLEVLDRDRKRMDANQYERQKAGLLEILPKEKTIEEITFDPTDRFITKIETGRKKNVYGRYGGEQVSMTVEDAFVDWVWTVDRKLIGYGVQKQDIENFVRGNRQRKDTKHITVHIKSESRRLFNQFMREGLDAETQGKIVSEFNRTKNSYVRPEYDRIPVVVNGMAKEYNGKPFALSPTQRNGIGFLVNKGSGLVAYGVGVGKTHTLLIATKANMDKGWTKRPLFVVPASTLAGWIDTTKRMFPGMKVNNLAGLQSPMVAKLRKNGEPTEWVKDGEISFITHEGILRLGFDGDEIFELTKDLNDALGTFDYKLTTREIEQAKEKAQEVLGQSLKGSTDILMRDLGFDHVSVDEVHNFRKVFQGAKVEEDSEGNASQRRRFSNVTGGQPSARARKLFLISQYVQKKNGGRNVFLASATPFENHATEVYNVLSFMARDRMRQMGIYNINDFYSTFANFQTETIQKTDGSWQEKEVMKSFSNLKQLQSLLQEFIDKKEERTIVRPEKVVIAPQLKMSPLQAEVKQKIREMIASDDDGVLLKATTYMKANSFSPYFVPEFGGVPKDMYEFVKNSPKVEYAMEMLKTLKNDPATAGRSNFVYIGSEGISFTPMYVDYLVKEVGYKREEIGVITGEVSDEVREDIKEKFNTGEIKVLIGGTPTKEWINLQMNGYATFNLSLGWNPTEMAQVEGRIWRQGNNLNKALIVYPIVENSGDIGIYQKFEEKASRINDLFSYEGDVFDVGEIDPKEKKLLLLTDPTEKANLAIKLEEAQLQSQKLYVESEAAELEKSISELQTSKESVNRLESDLRYYREELAKIPEENEFSRKRMNDNITGTESLIKTAKGKIKRIEEKFANREISDPKAELESLKKKAEGINAAITDSKLSFERLLEKYQREYDQNVLNTKTMEDHRAQIAAVNSQLRERSAEELMAEKSRLMKEAERSEDKKTEEAIKKSLSEGGKPDEDGGLRVPSGVPRRTPGSGALASKTEGGISLFEKTGASEWTEAFKLSNRVRKVIEGLETQYTRYVAPGSSGTFYTGSKNVALHSVNDVQVAHHELSHLVDDRAGITEKLLSVVGRTKKGAPIYDSQYAEIRNLLSEVYVKRYPGARKTDKLRIRVKEGYAALQENALAFPTATKRDFPKLWDMFVENGHDLQKWLNSEMRMIVDDYQGLSANDTIGAVVTNETRNKEAKSFLNFWDRMKELLTDAYVRVERIDELAGTYGTSKGAADLMRASPAIRRRVAKNMEKGHGFWHFENGQLVEKSKENFADVVYSLADRGRLDTFVNYLVARRSHFDWLRLDELNEKLAEAEKEAWPFPTNDDVSVIEKIRESRDELKKVLDTDAEILPRNVTDSVYEEFRNEFSHEESVHDMVIRSDLDFQKYVGKLSEESHKELSERKGYTPFKRSITDEIVGDGVRSGTASGLKPSKASFLKKRTGASHDIINPVIGVFLNHSEGTSKGFAQMMANRLVDNLRTSPELRSMVQEVEVETVKVGDRIEYRVNGEAIQKDQNVLVKYVDGKPAVALVIGKELMDPLKMATDPFKRNFLEVALTAPARVFTTGTTGMFPAFSVGNASADQFTAYINSKTGYKPFVSMSPIDASKALYYDSGLRKAIESLGAEIVDYDSPDAMYIKEFMALGGDVMSLSDIHRLSGDEIIARLAHETKGIETIKNALVSGLDLADAVLGTPGRLSELMTRITEYVRARKAGDDQYTALNKSQQISFPFSYRGTIEKEALGRVVIGGVPYMRAGFHALDGLITALRKNPGAGWRVAAVVALTSALFAYLASLYDEMDEESKIALENMDPTVFAQYVLIPIGKGEFFKMKFDRQTNWIPASLFMMYMEVRHGFKYSVSEYEDVMTSWIPDPMKIWNPLGAIVSVIPQWMKPSLEMVFGKRFFPKIRDIESSYDKLFLSEDRYDESNSKAAIALSQTEFAKSAGKDGISAKELDTFLRDTFGRSIDAVTMWPKFWDVSNPLVQKEYFTSGRIVQQFFDAAEKSEQEKNSAEKNGKELTAYQTARIRHFDAVKKLFKDLRGLEQGTPEYSQKKAEIWDSMREAIAYSPSDVTPQEVSSFEKSKEQDEWKVRKEALVSTYVNQFRNSKESMKATKLENALKQEIIGDAKKSDPKYSTLVSRATAAIEEFRVARSGDEFIRSISKMQNNTEKVAAFQKFKASMSAEEYAAKVRDYRSRKLISDELAKVLLKNR